MVLLLLLLDSCLMLVVCEHQLSEDEQKEISLEWSIFKMESPAHEWSLKNKNFLSQSMLPLSGHLNILSSLQFIVLWFEIFFYWEAEALLWKSTQHR